jgi:hypothetical protein
LPFITATTEKQSMQASAALGIIGTYTVAFFDRELKDRKDTIFDGKSVSKASVTVEKYGNLN